MIKINYKSDFDAILTVRDADGVDIGYPTSNWTATFFTRNGGVMYIASHIDGVDTNCFDDDGKIHVVFDGHELEPGYLKVKFEIDLPDMIYPDNVRNLVQLQMMDIMLVDGASDADLALLSMVAQIPVLRDGNIDLSNYYTKPEVDAIADSKQDTIVDLADIRSGARKGATALQSYTETDPIYMADKPNLALKTELATKQDTISDLETIREGALLGKTALQEHQDISGLATKEEVAGKQDTISDLASIREGARKGATALQSYTEIDPVYMADKPKLALKSEIPDISGKADKTTIVTETEGNASYAILPNVLTKLGTLASSVILSLDTSKEESGVTNVYDIVFTTPAEAPSITWPEGISWIGGSAPATAGGKTYEVSIMDNLATYGEF